MPLNTFRVTQFYLHWLFLAGASSIILSNISFAHQLLVHLRLHSHLKTFFKVKLLRSLALLMLASLFKLKANSSAVTLIMGPLTGLCLTLACFNHCSIHSSKYKCRILWPSHSVPFFCIATGTAHNLSLFFRNLNKVIKLVKFWTL